MSRRWISLPQRAGEFSRQAHADLPAGTFERELGKEGFFGPATHMYHRHPPTGWTSWEGPLRPRAFDLTRLAERARLALGGAAGAGQCPGASCAGGSWRGRWSSWSAMPMAMS